MTHFANLKSFLSKSLCNSQQSTREAAPEISLARAPFDSLRIVDSGLTPSRLPALFDSCERILGHPARLFPERVCITSETANLDRVKLQWLDVLDGLKPYGLRGQIAGINTYLNRFADAPTLARLGGKLPWTAPLNIFHNAGSEHIAFAKYLSLRKIGINAERLRLVWINDGHDQTSRIVLSATLPKKIIFSITAARTSSKTSP